MTAFSHKRPVADYLRDGYMTAFSRKRPVADCLRDGYMTAFSHKRPVQRRVKSFISMQKTRPRALMRQQRSCAVRDLGSPFASGSCLPFCAASPRRLEPLPARQPAGLSPDARALPGPSPFFPHNKTEEAPMDFFGFMVRCKGLEPLTTWL